MINRTTLAALAALTFVLFLGGAIIGEGRDVLWIVDDIFGFLLCALVLVVLTVGVLARTLARSWRQRA